VSVDDGATEPPEPDADFDAYTNGDGAAGWHAARQMGCASDTTRHCRSAEVSVSKGCARARCVCTRLAADCGAACSVARRESQKDLEEGVAGEHALNERERRRRKSLSVDAHAGSVARSARHRHLARGRVVERCAAGGAQASEGAGRRRQRQCRTRGAGGNAARAASRSALMRRACRVAHASDDAPSHGRLARRNAASSARVQRRFGASIACRPLAGSQPDAITQRRANSF